MIFSTPKLHMEVTTESTYHRGLHLTARWTRHQDYSTELDQKRSLLTGGRRQNVQEASVRRNREIFSGGEAERLPQLR